MYGNSNGGMLKNIVIVVSIVMFVLFIFNKTKKEQSPEEIVKSFVNELLAIEDEKTRNAIQNYLDAIGVKSNFEIYELSKEAERVSLLAAESFNNINIKNNIPKVLIQEMNNIKSELASSYEILATAFSYATKYYGGDLNKEHAISFRTNYDEAIRIQEESKDALVTLELFANSFVEIMEDQENETLQNENNLSES